MFKEFWQNNKVKIIHMIGFWVTLALGFMATDGADVLLALYGGDFSDTIVTDLRRLIMTTLVKVILVLVFPALFPLYKKGNGIIESDVTLEKIEVVKEKVEDKIKVVEAKGEEQVEAIKEKANK